MSGFMSLPLFIILVSNYACTALQDWGMVLLLHRIALDCTVPFLSFSFFCVFKLVHPIQATAIMKTAHYPGALFCPNAKL